MTRLAVSWLGSPSLCAEARAILVDTVAARGSVTLVDEELPSEFVLRLIVDGSVLTNHGARGYSVAALLYRRVSLLEGLSPEYCAALERDEEVSRLLRAVDGARVPILVTCESGAPLPEKVERILGRVLDEIGRQAGLPVESALVEEPRFQIEIPPCEDETLLGPIAAGEPMDVNLHMPGGIGLNAATGRTSEEAAAALRELKRQRVPRAEVEGATSAGELDARLRRSLATMQHEIAVINTLLQAAPETVRPDYYRRTAQTVLHAIWSGVDELAQSVEERNPRDATHAGFILRHIRTGTLHEGFRLEVKLPGE